MLCQVMTDLAATTHTPANKISGGTKSLQIKFWIALEFNLTKQAMSQTDTYRISKVKSMLRKFCQHITKSFQFFINLQKTLRKTKLYLPFVANRNSSGRFYRYCLYMKFKKRPSQNEFANSKKERSSLFL